MAVLLKGLTAADVAERERAKKVNVIPDRSSKSALGIVLSNIFTYFNAIFAVLTVLLIIVQSWKSLTFLPVVIANMVIGIYQQLKAKKVLDDLRLLATTDCTVIRDGAEQHIPVDQLVLDDLIVLEAGQQIPADAEVVQGKVNVNEALLTGESDEIEKERGAELMSGSFVVSGSCYARLTHVGADSYAAQLTAKAKQVKDKQSEMVRGIDLIVMGAGIVIIPVGVALWWEAVALNGKTNAEAIVSMVGAVIGMIPEGLYLLVTIAFALSAARLAKSFVLLHDMRSTETLARVDVLCVDKTGTITSNEMNVTEVFPAASSEDPAAAERLLARYVSTVSDSNITMVALKKHFATLEPLAATEVTPFSSKLKYSEVTCPDGTYRFGAPEFLMSIAQLEANQDLIEAHTAEGERVLALVRGTDGAFEPVVFVSLANGLRPNVEETFAYLTQQEVEVRVISGDNPLTVSSIATRVGIPGAERYVDVSTLTTDEEIKEAVENYVVFGRVKPEQKKQLVEALKGTGKRVAMTGDGVNDILAMKEADCSIAMGAGSDAARQAAQVVLLDSDFSHMREIISEGRRDINNITRSATLFLYKNFFSLMLATFSIITFFTYPLQASQVSLISAFNIGIPAFLLAMEPNEKKQKGHFLSEIISKALPAAITSFAAIAAMEVFADLFDISAADVSTASTYLLSVVGFMILWRICKPMNRYRALTMLISILGLFGCAIYLNGLFSITEISTRSAILCVVFAIAEESVMRNLTWVFDRRVELIDGLKRWLRG